MAQKRMFSKEITNSEEFLEMPVSSQALYFHLNMNADDDGFVQPKLIMRMIASATDDDLKLLKAKGFVIPVADRVIVITHWHVNNTIRKDRYSATIFKEHLKALGINRETKAYIGLPVVDRLETDINNQETQVRLEEDRKEKIIGGTETVDNFTPDAGHIDGPGPELEDPLSPEQKELDNVFDDEDPDINYNAPNPKKLNDVIEEMHKDDTPPSLSEARAELKKQAEKHGIKYEELIHFK